MVAGDLHSFPEVEPVRLVPLHPGVELEGTGALLSRDTSEPVEHSPAVALRTGILDSYKVVYVEEFSVGQKLDDPVPRHAPHLPTLGRSGEPVTGALHASYHPQVLVLGQ